MEGIQSYVLNRFETFAMVVRPDPVSALTAQKLREMLTDRGFREDPKEAVCVIVIGGDGTFLWAIHEYMESLRRRVFVGVHSGTLGFFMDYMDSEKEEFVEDMTRGMLQVERYPVLEARTEGECLYAVNEVRIENPIRTQNITVYLDGEKFEDFRGSGMCLCSQLGSGAYNRSLGGAVLQKGLRAIELAEIAGIHHSRFRSLGVPFVMSDRTRVTFVSEDFTGAVLGTDSSVMNLPPHARVEVRCSSDCPLQIVRGKKVSDFRRLERLF